MFDCLDAPHDEFGMPEIVYTTTKAIELDAVNYSYSVYQNRDMFMGFWNCDHCHKHQMISLMQPDQNSVARLCEQLIGKHHAESHSKTSQN